jgi:hypothetical protein
MNLSKERKFLEQVLARDNRITCMMIYQKVKGLVKKSTFTVNIQKLN